MKILKSKKSVLEKQMDIFWIFMTFFMDFAGKTYSISLRLFNSEGLKVELLAVKSSTVGCGVLNFLKVTIEQSRNDGSAVGGEKRQKYLLISLCISVFPVDFGIFLRNDVHISLIRPLLRAWSKISQAFAIIDAKIAKILYRFFVNKSSRLDEILKNRIL